LKEFEELGRLSMADETADQQPEPAAAAETPVPNE